MLAQSDPPLQRRLGWIAVSHVCHRWREIALGHSLLWTYISTDSGSRLMDLMFQRSEEAPLTLSGSGFPKRSSLVKGLLQTHLPRIVDLDIPSELVRLAYGDDLPLPGASKLRRIQLTETPGGLLDYPIHFCSDRAPSLRSVHLTYVKLPWAISPFTNLVSLSIDNSGFFNEWDSNMTDPGNAPTLSQILDILRSNLKTLEVLELAGCLPLYTPPFPARADDGAVLNFPLLRELVLETNYHTGMAVFMNISIPIAARLQLHLTAGVSGQFDYVVSSNQLAWFALSRSPSLTPSRTLEVTVDACTLLTRFWPEELVDGDIQSSQFTPQSRDASQMKFDRAILFSSLSDTIQSVLSSGLSTTPHVTTLLFKLSTLHSTWSADDWLVAFGFLRTLRHLKVSGTAAVSLICILPTRFKNLDNEQPELHTTRSLPFERLSHLALSFVDFETSLITMVDGPEQPCETTLLDVFITELYERRQAELDDSNSMSRIRWLSIQSCTIKERWVQLLRECVDHVEWDGCTEPYLPFKAEYLVGA